MKVIELPIAEGALYQFGSLPGLIADALHPRDRYPDDHIVWCAIWRDDGGDGAYFCCKPPDGERCAEIGDAAGWSIVPIPLSDEEREHPDRSKWVNWRWGEQRRPAAEQQRWPDGSLIVASESTQHQPLRSACFLAEYEWYANRLREASDLERGDSRRLCVLDGLGNEIEYRHGRSIDNGVVHLDELNRWGATLRPPRSFAVGATPSGSTLAPHDNTTSRIATKGYADGMLATRQQLVDAYHRYVGMDLTWFERLKDSPALKAARKITGQGGRASRATEPMFCPFEVMTFLTKKGRKVGNPLSEEKAWELLERHFPKVYAANQIGDPRG